MAHEHAKQLVEAQEGRTRVILMFVGGVLLINSALALWIFERPFYSDAMAFAAAMLLGVPLVIQAFKDLASGHTHMDELAALAVIAAFAVGAYLEAGFVAFFVVLTTIIEHKTAMGARKSIESLVRITPTRAHRKNPEDGAEAEGDAKDLVPGDVVVVRPGDNIPGDGVVLSGQSTVNQANITGESLPVDKAPDDEVFGGQGNDTVTGGAGQDQISGGSEQDDLYGDDGNDTLDGDEDEDLLDGGQGEQARAHGDLRGAPGQRVGAVAQRRVGHRADEGPAGQQHRHRRPTLGAVEAEHLLDPRRQRRLVGGLGGDAHVAPAQHLADLVVGPQLPRQAARPVVAGLAQDHRQRQFALARALQGLIAPGQPLQIHRQGVAEAHGVHHRSWLGSARSRWCGVWERLRCEGAAPPRGTTDPRLPSRPEVAPSPPEAAPSRPEAAPTPQAT